MFRTGLNKKNSLGALDSSRSTGRDVLVGLLGLLAVLVLLLPACSDDPILGPPDDGEDGGGGSYSNIKRLAPPGSSQTEPKTSNPERF